MEKEKKVIKINFGEMTNYKRSVLENYALRTKVTIYFLLVNYYPDEKLIIAHHTAALIISYTTGAKIEAQNRITL